MITGIDDAPSPRTQLEATICWMSPKPIKAGGKYRLRHTTRLVKAVVTGIQHRVDPNTLEKQPSPSELQQRYCSHFAPLLPIACDTIAKTARPAHSSSSTPKRHGRRGFLRIVARLSETKILSR
jgi:hypothetical protein